MTESSSINFPDIHGLSPQRRLKWGGFASLLLVVSFIAAQFIYLTGNLDAPLGPLTYTIADILFGPVCVVCLIMVFIAIRDRIGDEAPQRMSLAFLCIGFTAATMLLVACIRASNRHYIVTHPDLHLGTFEMYLNIWTTVIQGILAAGWHLLGWSLILTGWAGWTSRKLPVWILIIIFITGIFALPVIVFPDIEGLAGLFAVICAICLGVWLLLTKTSLGGKSVTKESNPN